MQHSLFLLVCASAELVSARPSLHLDSLPEVHLPHWDSLPSSLSHLVELVSPSLTRSPRQYKQVLLREQPSPEPQWLESSESFDDQFEEYAQVETIISPSNENGGFVADFNPLTTISLTPGPPLPANAVHELLSHTLDQIFDQHDPQEPLPRKLWLHNRDLGAAFRLDFTAGGRQARRYTLCYQDLIRFLIALDELVSAEEAVPSRDGSVPSFQGVVKPLARLDTVIGVFSVERWGAELGLEL